MWRRAQGTVYVPPIEVDASDEAFEEGFDTEFLDFYVDRYDARRTYFSVDSFMNFAKIVGLNALTASYNHNRNRLYPNASAIAEQLAQ